MSWEEKRQYREHDQRWCECDTCSQASDICSVCEDWSGTFLPEVICSNCGDSYHLHCLPRGKRNPGSWKVCSEIGSDYHCGHDLKRFSLGIPEQYQNINIKIEQMEKQSPDRVPYHTASQFYRTFRWNRIHYKIGEYIQVILDHGIGIARIHALYLNKANRFMVVVEWLWSTNDPKATEWIMHRYPNDGDCRLFEEQESFYVNEISVESVKGKVFVETESSRNSIQRCLSRRQCLEIMHQRISRLVANGKCVGRNSIYKDTQYRSAYVMMNEKFNSIKGCIVSDGDPESEENELEEESEESLDDQQCKERCSLSPKRRSLRLLSRTQREQSMNVLDNGRGHANDDELDNDDTSHTTIVINNESDGKKSINGDSSLIVDHGDLLTPDSQSVQHDQ